MFLKRIGSKMQKWPGDVFSNGFPKINQKQFQTDYENVIKTLNGLQSNAEYIKHARKEKLTHFEEFSKTILQMQKYLLRCGVTLEMLDQLPVIHVSGTKGKGTTCALCESILRHHGLRTGFYSSPHLLEVRERIRINGAPLKTSEFVKHFWYIYNKLNDKKSSPNDMPMYFKFLTLMAFRVFLQEKVDVAIIEVGIGGEYDSTNILRNTQIVGITSLGLDHTSILGDTIDKIAWHKAGIIKSGCQVFTVPQPEDAIKVIRNRSCECNSTLQVVKPFLDQLLKYSKGPVDTYNLNASLAVSLAQAWLNLKSNIQIDITKSEITKLALSTCKWPGRYQILHDMNKKFYLDGAHTLESIEVCVEWFIQETLQSISKKVLIFNATGDRSSRDLLNKLKICKFQIIYFVPNKAGVNSAEDHKNFNNTYDKQLARCYEHYNFWMEIENQTDNYRNLNETVKVLPSISDALQDCRNEKCDILITGSLHLVGATLSIIHPELQ